MPYRYIGVENFVIENDDATVKGNIIMISGCKDIQTSADAWIQSDMKGEYAGAITSAFLHTMKHYDYTCTCFHLLNGMRNYLKDGDFKQVPQICSSNKLTNISIFSAKNGVETPFLL